MTTKRSCNRHDDCDAADRKVQERYNTASPREKINLPRNAEHCDDKCCEECFGY